jgi:glucosyl-3-phosphoglycerate synthase
VSLSTVAVIPARDEAPSLPQTLGALETIPGLLRVLVVDDGSRDHTASVARDLGADLVPATLPGESRGKGHALRLGLISARAYDPEAFLLADADLGSSAALLPALLDSIDDDHPIAIAAFPPAASSGGFGLVKALSRRAIHHRTGYAPEEPLSGQRALLPAALDVLPGIAPGFGAEVGMTLDLLLAGVRPLEVPLALTHRATGRTLPGFAHRARQGLDIARALHGTRLPW